MITGVRFHLRIVGRSFPGFIFRFPLEIIDISIGLGAGPGIRRRRR